MRSFRIIAIRMIAVAVCLLTLQSAAFAHHGWAAFGSGPTITLKGTVTDFHYVNPHSVVEFEVADENGKAVSWEGELSAPGPLARKGWTASSLQPGDQITISGWQAKNGSHALRVSKIVRPDGKELTAWGGN